MLKIIDNFTGKLTRQNIGDMNSGLAKYATTFGTDPFSNPSNLTWLEQPTSILVTGSGTGPITAMKSRMESGTEYVYAVPTGNSSIASLYKIQVNNTSTKNPNYDHASIIGALSAVSPTFRIGPAIQFYGATEKLFIGGDNGVTKINFDGSGEAFIGNLVSYTQNVPRPVTGFLGKLYFGNGNNIGEIDSTETITTYTKLQPGFPSGTYVRDLDVSPDGNYLQITVSRLNQTSLDGNTLDTSSLGSVDSYKFLWNGTDPGYTSYETYNGYSLTANTTFANNNFTLGYDLGGTALYSGADKIISMPNSVSPNFGAMFSTGNLLGFATPEYDMTSGHYKGSIYFYGQYDEEIPKGLFRFLRQTATQGADVIVMPSATTVTNLSYVPPFYGYTNNIGGAAKLYFSTIEVVQGGGLQIFYNLFTFSTVPTGSGLAIGGVYETQQETSLKLFRSIVSRKFKPTLVRFYVEPLVANNSFQIDIIGSDGNPMTGGSCTFTPGTSPTAVGDDMVQYTPKTSPTYSMGIRITNLGTVNWTGVKLEIEYEEAGVK